jgi:DNA-binding protein HU-beta
LQQAPWQSSARPATSRCLSLRSRQPIAERPIGIHAEHLQQGTKIRIPGLGIFQVSARAARMGRNPATGEPIQIKASKKIAFRPAKELKEAI